MKRRPFIASATAVASPLIGGCMFESNSQGRRVPYFEIKNYSGSDVSLTVKILGQDKEYLYKNNLKIGGEELTDPIVVEEDPKQLVMQIDNNEEIVKSWPKPGTVCGSDPKGEPPGVTIQLENADTEKSDVDVYFDWQCHVVQSTSTRAE